MSNDLVADFLTRIRNAQAAGHSSVTVRKSTLVERLLNVLKQEGFVDDFKIESDAESSSTRNYTVFLKYFPDGSPMISTCRRVSKSGRRMYSQSSKLPRIKSGLGIAIVSTSEGVMTDREARKRGIGGEILAAVS